VRTQGQLFSLRENGICILYLRWLGGLPLKFPGHHRNTTWPGQLSSVVETLWLDNEKCDQEVQHWAGAWGVLDVAGMRAPLLAGFGEDFRKVSIRDKISPVLDPRLFVATLESVSRGPPVTFDLGATIATASISTGCWATDRIDSRLSPNRLNRTRRRALKQPWFKLSWRRCRLEGGLIPRRS